MKQALRLAVSAVGNAIVGTKIGLSISSSVTTRYSNNISYPSGNGFSGGSRIARVRVSTELQRYGGTQGRFVTYRGTTPQALSLPPDKLGLYPTNLVVLKSFSARVGIAAPWFNQSGGGVQILLFQSLQRLIKRGFIGLI